MRCKMRSWLAVVAFLLISAGAFSQLPCSGASNVAVTVTPDPALNRVTVSWNPFDHGLNNEWTISLGYAVKYGIGNTNTTTVGTTGTSIVISDLSFAAIYSFQVHVNLNADHTASQTNIQVNCLTNPVKTATILPSVPTLTGGTSPTNTSINITWTGNGGNYDYEVFVSPSNQLVKSGNVIGVTSVTVEGLLQGTNYFYRIRARNSTGTTAFSPNSGLILTRPAAPAFNSPTNISTTGFKSTWT